MPSTLQRLVGSGKRSASPSTLTRQQVPDFIADGADLVPAPTVYVHAPGDQKAGSSVVDWRAELAETDAF
jgi:hypothetical protein